MDRLLSWCGHISTIFGAYSWYVGGGIGTAMAAAGIFLQDYPRTSGALIGMGLLVFLVSLMGFMLIPPSNAPRPIARDWFYQNPFRRISWKLGNLQIGSTSARSAVIHDFSCALKINRGSPNLKRFYLETPTGRKIHIKIQCGPEFVFADRIERLPLNHWHLCMGRILLNDNYSDDGRTNHPTPDQFLSTIGEFDLVLEYDNKSFRRRYPRHEIKRMIDLYGESQWRTPEPKPTLKTNG
jgi:hypothetical protein